jgi:hypothetical protein
MTAIRFFTDEDIFGAVAPALRRAGFDAISTPEAGRLNESDESQLAWAAQSGRTLVTFNVSHFANLHPEWMAQTRHHAGIIVSSQRPIGDLLARLVHVADEVDAETMVDRLEFLSNW